MLEEDNKYETVSGKKVFTHGTMSFDDMTFYYGHEILKILGEGDKGYKYEQQQEILKNESVVTGLTSDSLMPSGYRHVRSGKCLCGNTPMPSHSEKYGPYLATFDIKT